MSILLLALLACDGFAEGDATCASFDAGMEKDRCLHDRIDALGPDQVALVIEAAKAVTDPMIRGAAISRWVATHAKAINHADGEALCGLLDGRDQSYCQRRLSSPHLQR